jgi:hypothetical protein
MSKIHLWKILCISTEQVPNIPNQSRWFRINDGVRRILQLFLYQSIKRMKDQRFVIAPELIRDGYIGQRFAQYPVEC